MATYQIITDSCCDFTRAQYEARNVSCVPLTLNYRGQLYESFTEAHQLKEFYEGIRRGEMPTTSAANPDAWARVMESFLNQGQDVLCLTFTSALSATYQSALMAAEDLKEKYPQREILVVDTLCAALGQGLLVHYACEKRDQGMDIRALAAWIRETRLHICHEVTVNDLDHLKRGGRISAATAFVGGMLNIKPMIHVDDEGRLVTIGKIRGRKAAMEQLVKRFGELKGNYVNQTVFIAHGDCPEDAEKLESLLRAAHPEIQTVHKGYVGGVIGAHTGPGVLVVFFLGEHR